MNFAKLLNSRESLEKLIVQDLPTTVAYKLYKFIKELNKELETFDEFKVKLLDKYGEKQTDNSYLVNGENKQLFESDLQTLLDSDVKAEYPTFTLEELKDAKLSVKDLTLLDYLIGE